MAKRQTRRAISVKGRTYLRLKRYCEKHDMSISGYLEQRIAEDMDAAGEPEVHPDEIRARRPRPDTPPEFPAHMMWGAQ